ncbi:MAG: YIP1 family protein, partial [Candidatus Hodarchaeales archaeon]
MAIITFDQEKIMTLANDESATNQAILVVFLASLSGFMPRFLDFMTFDNKEAKYSAFIEAFIAFFTIFLMFILFSVTIAFVIHGFGSTGTLVQCSRVFGFAQVWTLIGSITNLVLSIINLQNDTSFTVLLGLVGLVVFIFGLTSFSNLPIGSAIISTIIA